MDVLKELIGLAKQNEISRFFDRKHELVTGYNGFAYIR